MQRFLLIHAIFLLKNWSLDAVLNPPNVQNVKRFKISLSITKHISSHLLLSLMAIMSKAPCFMDSNWQNTIALILKTSLKSFTIMVCTLDFQKSYELILSFCSWQSKEFCKRCHWHPAICSLLCYWKENRRRKTNIAWFFC